MRETNKPESQCHPTESYYFLNERNRKEKIVSMVPLNEKVIKNLISQNTRLLPNILVSLSKEVDIKRVEHTAISGNLLRGLSDLIQEQNFENFNEECV